MPLSWTFPQLLIIAAVTFVFLSLSFSKSKPVMAGLVVIFATHYLVINTTCWNTFMRTMIWQGGENVFRYHFSPVLSAVSFYGGLLIVVALLVCLVTIARARSHYSIRQRAAFSASVVAVLVGVMVSLMTPVGFQSILDSMPPTENLLNSSPFPSVRMDPLPDESPE